MTIHDPTQPLLDSLVKLKLWSVEERRFLEELAATPARQSPEVLGEIGALFAHFNGLLQDNQKALQEALVHEERQIRKVIDNLLTEMIQQLVVFRGK